MLFDFSLKPDDRRFTIATVGFFLLYALLVGVGILHHEPWVDEVHPWLVAQDANLWTMIFEQLHWDAHPGLWYLLLKFWSTNLPGNGLACLAYILALINAAYLLFYSKIPILWRVCLSFSYIFFYQNPIVSRSYVLYPILFTCLAALWEKRKTSPWLYGAILALTSSVSVHGMVMTTSLLAVEWLETRNSLRNFLKPHYLIPYGMNALVIAFWFSCLIPALQPMRKTMYWWESLEKGKMLLTMLSPSLLTTILLLLALLFWVYQRRDLWFFFIPFLASTAFMLIVYVSHWHEGILFAWCAVFLIRRLQWNHHGGKVQRSLTVFALFLVFIFQLKWSACAWMNDFKNPYGSAQELAVYIRKHEIEKRRFFGFSCRIEAANFYFEKNIFSNSWRPDRRYYSWNCLKDLTPPKEGKILNSPDYFAIDGPTRASPPQTFPGYRWIRRFEGTIFWKDYLVFENNCDLYERSP